MNITPVIPDGYDGPIKQLTCRICKHLFYLTMTDYQRLENVSYCHECSLILMEELEKTQEIPGHIVSKQEPALSTIFASSEAETCVCVSAAIGSCPAACESLIGSR